MFQTELDGKLGESVVVFQSRESFFHCRRHKFTILD